MTQKFDIPEYGGCLFVWARPIYRYWSYYDVSTYKSGNEEYRPVMISGHDSGQRVWVHGSQYAYPLDEFEFGDVLK